MAYTISPLRYPGGKTSLSRFLSSVLNANGLKNGVYAEAYAGGAGAALTLLQEGWVKRIHINDADPRVYRFWHSLICYPEEYIKRIKEVPLDIQEWERQKRTMVSYKSHDDLDVGFAVFYMNRCNRSGILSASPIGGKSQTGKWKIDARFNRDSLVERIGIIARMADSIEVSGEDALVFLDALESEEERCLVFLDPPYFEKGKSLYLNYYVEENHADLANRLKTLQLPWLMTYDSSKYIRGLYEWCDVREFSIRHSARQAKTGTELLISPHALIGVHQPRPYYVVVPPALHGDCNTP